jgi:lipopolysaccharide transport system ATP-binding protein
MNRPVIQALNLSKIYRLYEKPHHRFLDMFGLLSKNSNAYTEYPALNHVSLSINRGEKVAIIGRNGAGKSTFLKIVSKIIEPSGGHINVKGQVHALLSIGAGFHPDFTGRENVYAYLEHMGLSGASADEKVEEIVQFAEIEEYIDQPIKTYSTGMGARLMFSTSTSIAPDILVIDEVLGVGDAYFTKKSYDRMRDLCDAGGTTLLLVTHDVYAASAFCNRMVWIDRGQIVQDDDCDVVVKAYEASIRLQEEERLRQRTLSNSNRLKKAGGSDRTSLFCQLVTHNRVPLKQNLTICGIKLLNTEGVIDAISMETGESTEKNTGSQLILKNGEGNWSKAYEKKGLWCRDFQPFGSIFQRAPFVFYLKGSMDEIGKDAAVEIELFDERNQSCFIEIYTDSGHTLCENLGLEGTMERRSIRLGLSSIVCSEGDPRKPKVFGLESQQDLSESGNYIGSKRLSIDSVVVEDGRGSEKLVFEPNETMTIIVRFSILDKSYSGKPAFLASIHKEGIRPSTRIISQDLKVHNNSSSKHRKVTIQLKPVLLGPGVYSITVGLYEHDYFEYCHGRHYAANHMVMDVVKNAVYFEIKTEKIEFYRIEYIQPAEWTIEDEAAMQ